MTYTAIDSARYNVGKAAKKDLFEDSSLNFADHESRIAAIEASSLNTITVFNQIVDLQNSRVGEIKYYLLTQEQIGARLNSKWVEIDGGSISGEDLASLYGATLPDGRGRFPRILDGTRTVGQLETNQNKAHTHTVIGKGTEPGGGNIRIVMNSDATSGDPLTSVDPTGSSGGTESRPDSLVISAVTKVSETEFDYCLIYRAPAAFNVTQLNISNLIAGSSGTLEVDLLSGSALGSLTSLLVSNLELDYDEGDYATSLNADFSTTAISIGDFIVLKLVSVQAGQDRFFVNCSGSAT